MATTQQVRQSQLFAAQDWQVIYTAYTQINFSAYDFSTIRTAMINYIRLNYPEDFTDWIESSEFVALIDLLAYLGQSLAFRMDLNTRENFIETATRRDSIFRLARMLSYQPQRSIPASGLLQITSIISDQPIIDADGNNLQNIRINWNDLNNPNWYEQFILVLNATLNSTNTFGKPTQSGVVNGIQTQLYEMNNTSIPTSVLPFIATAAGNTINCELINVSFDSGTTTNLLNAGSFYEVSPNPLNSWGIIYQNDGNGFASPNTGFFFYFKQGTMQYQDYACDQPIANRIIDVNADNVNQTDVWVQLIDNNGLVISQWTQVPAVVGNNIIYNSLANSIRNIYSVISRNVAGNDQISIRFADGTFGNVPVGIVRVWYRVSNNLTYQITPNDILNQVFAFGYADNLNNIWNVAFAVNLQYTVTNAQAGEPDQQIALNAPQTYYTQDRMANGEDYNLFPLSEAAILKVKAVNRFYSGQSRYLNINDPTGNYNDLNVVCTDGIFYSETDLNTNIISNYAGINYQIIVNTQIQPMINGSLGDQTTATELKQFYYYYYPTINIPSEYSWTSITSSTKTCTGAFYVGDVAVQVGNSAPVNSVLAYINKGSIIKFASGIYASVVGIIGNGTGINLTGSTNGITVGPNAGPGAITLSIPVASNDIPIQIIPEFNTTLTPTSVNSIAAAMALQTTFGIRYAQAGIPNSSGTLDFWIVIPTADLNSSDTFSMQYAGDTSNTNKDNSWLLLVTWNGAGWVVNSRASRYIFESASQNQFYFDNFEKSFNPNTGSANYDSINILGTNSNSQTEIVTSTAPVLSTGSYTITLDSTIGITQGQIVIGVGIPVATTVLNVMGNTITLNNAATSTQYNAVLSFYPAPSLGQDYLWQIIGQQIDPDGYTDPSSVRVTMWQSNNYGVPNDPTEYNEVVNPSYTPQLLLFWVNTTDSSGYQYWQPIQIPLTQIFQNVNQLPPITVIINGQTVINTYWTPGKIVYITNQTFGQGIMYQYQSISAEVVGTLVDVTSNYKIRIGRNNLSFLWVHYAPTDQRINPAVTNVIDMYVLTSAYDTNLRNWIATNGSLSTLPVPETSAQLAANFSNLDQYAMMTDQMVWHPVTYVLLFGPQAAPELQANFLVVPVPGTTFTNNQIQSLVIQSINQYFALSNWDFGDSFFFTEMAAYVHQNLATIIGSIVMRPISAQAVFGDLFEIQVGPDQIPISCATVNNVQIVQSLNDSVLGITNSNG
jgi:hypothetical protein